MAVCVTLGGLAAAVASIALLPFPISLVVVPLCAAFLVRTFVLMHDCSHGSLFRSRSANAIVGFITGTLTATPFARWRRLHAIHHATSGRLDRQGAGDITTWTVREYCASGRWARFLYRCYRNPLVLLGLGPIWLFLSHRWCGMRRGAREQWSVHLTNVFVLVMFFALLLLLGPLEFVTVYLPAVFLAAAAGIWLFYVQHQFDGTYWASGPDWNYTEAALRGSSWYRLPRPLDWITGSIGFHHVHHLDPRIPHYDLRHRHRTEPAFAGVRVLTIGESLRVFSLKLWDEGTGSLIGWRDLRRLRKPSGT